MPAPGAPQLTIASVPDHGLHAPVQLQFKQQMPVAGDPQVLQPSASPGLHAPVQLQPPSFHASQVLQPGASSSASSCSAIQLQDAHQVKLTPLEQEYEETFQKLLAARAQLKEQILHLQKESF